MSYTWHYARRDLLALLSSTAAAPFAACSRDELSATSLVQPKQANLLVIDQNFLSVREYSGATGAFVKVAASSDGIPFGLVIGPDGSLLVSDANASQVKRYNLATGNLIGVLASTNLTFPTGMAIDGSDLYVANSNPPLGVQRFDAGTGMNTGSFVPSIANAWPIDVKVNRKNNRLYVLFYNPGAVEMFDLTSMASLGSLSIPVGSGGLADASAMTFAPDYGNLYICGRSSGILGVQRYDLTAGMFKGLFAGTGADFPTGVAFGPDNNLYVATFGRVRRFNYPGGTFKDFFISDTELAETWHLTFTPAIAAPVALDQSLPFGGTGLGVPVIHGKPGNHAYKSKHSKQAWCTVVMTVQHLGPLRGFVWNNRFDHAVGNVGYSDPLPAPHGGTISIQVRKVTSAPGAKNLTYGPVLAETPQIVAPARRQGWLAHYRIARGNPSLTTVDAADRFNEYPNLYFLDASGALAPFDIAQAGFNIGDQIAIQFRQWDAHKSWRADRWISINNPFRSKQPDDDRSPYPLAKTWSVYNGGDHLRDDHSVLLGMIHERPDGGNICKGNLAMGWTSNDREGLVSGTQQERQVIPIPTGFTGKKIGRVYMLPFRIGGTAGDLQCDLCLANGSAPWGDANDDGQWKASRVVSAMKIDVASGSLKKNINKNYSEQVWDFTSENITVTAGEAYYLRFSTTDSSTRYRFDYMLNYIAYNASRGVVKCDHEIPYMRHQRRRNGSWSTLDDRNQLGVWMELLPTDAAGPLT